MADGSMARLGRYRSLAWPLGAFLAIALLAAAAPLVAPHDPVRMDVAHRLAPPSLEHWLGQDEYGRDIFSRLVYGARASLSVALLASAIAGVIGVALGLVGGYLRGIAELFTVRLTDVILSFPPILLALLVVTILGPGIFTLTLVLSILYVPGYARVTYGEVLSASAQEYVEAARALGAGPSRIMAGTVLPNVAGPILVQFSLTVASAIVIESGLSFLGLGVVPPTPSWGLMIRGARGYMDHAPIGLVWPCLALVVTILVTNRLCDALRDAFDPRTREGTRGAVARFLDALGRYPDAGRGAAPGEAPLADDVVLAVEGLTTRFATPAGVVRAVEEVSFEVRRGETIAIVGESGSGKSVTALSIMRLLPEPAGRIVAGRIRLRAKDGRVVDLAALEEPALQRMRGNEMAMVFQDPMTSLNPVYRIGDQIAEAVRRHRAASPEEARDIAAAMLDTVGFPDPRERLRNFPHQLSGGMRQRAMIAMALACEPRVLIADEPTTALDVTIQAQILDLLRALKGERGRGVGIVFITHNLGVVAEIADRVVVMYAGRVVEEAAVEEIFENPRHPYTRGLLGSVPSGAGETAGDGRKPRLAAIPGNLPSPLELPAGCVYAPRCAYATDACRAAEPRLLEVGAGHRSRCIRWAEL